jgi:NADH-quinone oxidoreductase subunit A
MSENTLTNFAPLFLHFLLAVALGGAILLVSAIVGWRRPSRIKEAPYECGVEPVGDARHPVPVKYYLVAMVFILFDVEAIFLYPWAYVYRELRWFGFEEMVLYIGILLAGYAYLWKKGALDWTRPATRGDRGS